MSRSSAPQHPRALRGAIAVGTVLAAGGLAVWAWGSGAPTPVRTRGASSSAGAATTTVPSAAHPQPSEPRTGPPPADRPSPEDINVRGALSDRVDAILHASPGLDALFASGDATVIRRSEYIVEPRVVPVGELVSIRFSHRVDLPESAYRRPIPLTEATANDPSTKDATGRTLTVPVPPGQLHGVLVVEAAVDLELGRIDVLTPDDERKH